MKRNGFTLAELLAVIAILGIIALIVFPQVNTSIKNSKKRAYDQQVESILESASTWGLKNMSKLSEISENYISIETLQKSGYLEAKQLINPITDEVMDGCIVARYQNYQYIYQYVEDSCDKLRVIPIITLIGDSTVAVGIGEEYIDEGASAIYQGIDVTDYIKVENNVDTSKAGSYEVSYNVSYGDKQALEVVRTVIVMERNPVIVLSPKEVNDYKQSIAIDVSASVFYGNKVASMTYQLNGGSEQVVNDNQIILDSDGEHNLSVTVVDDEGNSSTVVGGTYKVDNTAPVISFTEGDNGLTLTTISALTYDLMTGVNVDDLNATIDDVEVSGDLSAIVGYYTVKYTVIDRALNTSVKTRKIYVTDSSIASGDIYIHSVKYKSDLGASTDISKVQANGTILNGTVSLSSVDPNSYITLSVTVLNGTNRKQQLLNIISGKDFVTEGNIVYSLEGVSVGSFVEAGDHITFDVTIKYKDGVNLSDFDHNFDISINFDFRPCYDIVYENFGDVEKYPTQVLGGTTLSVDFENDKASYIDVYSDNVQLSDYSISSNVITIDNVSSDIKFSIPLDEVNRVFLVYDNEQFLNVVPKDGESVSFSDVFVSTGNVLRCNQSAVPTFVNNVVSASQVVSDNTVCQVFGSLKDSVETADTSFNNLLMIDDENTTVGFEVASNKSINLDMNGHILTSTITGETEETSVYITNNGIMSVEDKLGTGLMKTNFYLFNNYGNLTFKSGHYKRENPDSTVGAIVLGFAGTIIIDNSDFDSDRTYVAFIKGDDHPLMKITNSSLDTGASTGGAVTNSAADSVVSIMNSTISNGANNAIYGSALNSSIYICGSTISGDLADLYSTNGKISYTANTIFTSGNNTPVINSETSYYISKNMLNTCYDEWYMVKDVNGKNVKNSDGSYARVGEELQFESQLSDQLVMDYNGGNATVGNNIWTYTPWPVDNESKDAQRFTILASNNASNLYYNIAAYYSPSIYVQNNGGTATNGNKILLANASNANDSKFKLKEITSGYYSFVTEHNTCIDIPGASKEIKTDLQNYACNGTNAQSWKLNVFR